MTPDDVFTAAYSKNRKNQPGILANPTELFAFFKRVYPVFWLVGARVNPGYFGKDLAVSFAGNGWARPADAEAIYRIEDPAGAEVIVVPLDERDADPFLPAVFEWAQGFRPAGNALDPVAGNLTFWYSKRPDPLPTSATALEALWPSSFDEMLVLEVALFLAMKDEREGEVAALRADRDTWLRRFIAHLEHATLGVTRSTGTAQRYTGPTLIPIASLLTAGSDVAL